MAERFVTVASYTVVLEAQLAAGLLDEEGITTYLTGGNTADTLGIGSLGGRIEVQVPEGDAARAHQILQTRGGELHSDDNWDENFDTATGVWVCTLCGEPTRLDHDLCQSCHTPQEAIQPGNKLLPPSAPGTARTQDKVQRRDQILPGNPVAPVPDLTEDSPDLPPATFLSDDLARRGFRAALFGAVVFPFTIYSMWLLFRLCRFPGELSSYAHNRLSWSFFLNLIVLIIWTFIFAGYFDLVAFLPE